MRLALNKKNVFRHLLVPHCPFRPISRYGSDGFDSNIRNTLSLNTSLRQVLRKASSHEEIIAYLTDVTQLIFLVKKGRFIVLRL